MVSESKIQIGFGLFSKRSKYTSYATTSTGKPFTVRSTRLVRWFELNVPQRLHDSGDLQNGHFVVSQAQNAAFAGHIFAQKVRIESLFDAEFVLHLLERVALGFRIEKEHDEELQNHHGGEEDEGRAGGTFREDRECSGDDGVHDPVRGAAEALTFGADACGKDFADIDPDHRALRDGEEEDITDKQPDQVRLVLLFEEDCGHACQADCGANRPDEQPRLASELIDDAHGEKRG